MRYSVDLQKIPEHERRFLDQDAVLAAQVLPEAPFLLPREQEMLDFYFDERSATPSEYPLDKGKALDLYARLYGTCDELFLVDSLRAMDQEFFASRAPTPQAPPMQPPTEGKG